MQVKARVPVPGVGEKFKAGPFIFAIEGQFPIVPVVIKGAAEFCPKGSFLPGSRYWVNHARIQILPPVSMAGLTQEDRPRVQEEVRMLMTKAYAQL
jgi:1-acyl-sn-glycerol-3-phosphate acyltransferase